MSGLVTQTRQKGRGSGLTQGFTFHRFTATYSNWPKPYGVSMIIVECIGAVSYTHLTLPTIYPV